MNAKAAARIRKEVYGDRSPRPDNRQYKLGPAGNAQADPFRRTYQQAKKAWTRQRKN